MPLPPQPQSRRAAIRLRPPHPSLPPPQPEKGGSVYPGAWFRYDFSPIMVRLVEQRHSVLEVRDRVLLKLRSGWLTLRQRPGRSLHHPTPASLPLAPQFLVSVCALLGGAYAISGVVDQVLYRSMQERKAK